MIENLKDKGFLGDEEKRRVSLMISNIPAHNNIALHSLSTHLRRYISI